MELVVCMTSPVDNKTVLVTGGTGSFGHQFAAELIQHPVKEVRILSRHEDLQHSMKREYPQFQYIIGDVRDYDRVLEAMNGVDVVVHAAALKQVPDCEAHPWEAVMTNVMGAKNVRRAAIERGVERVVFISTDKAVKPVNVMGMTKAIQERIFISDQLNGGAVFNGVRYGNVLGSRGSVVPFFLELARKGKKLPLTSIEMTRFMLSLREAVQLIFAALEDQTGRRIYVKKSPAAKMVDVARIIADSYHTDVDIVGIRPGEKLHETLVSEEEMRRVFETEDYYIIRPFGEPEAPSPDGYTEYTSRSTRLLTRSEIRSLLGGGGFLDLIGVDVRERHDKG